MNLTKRIGLARALSKLGYCSRSRAAELIREGRVRLNGALRRDPETPVRLGKDRIEVDGSAVASGRKIYLVLNKPRGVVTSASDEKGRATVYSHLPADLPWIAPVGRLEDTSLQCGGFRNGVIAERVASLRIFFVQTEGCETSHLQPNGKAAPTGEEINVDHSFGLRDPL